MATGTTEPRGARRRVLAAADVLFYERGINTVGVQEIVERAGVAKTSLYLHFVSKDELIATYLADRVALYEAEWRDLLERKRDEPPAAQLDAVFDVLENFVDHDGFRGCPFFNAAAELCDASHPGHPHIAEYRRFVRDDLFGEVARRAEVADPQGLAEKLQLLYDAALAASLLEGSSVGVRRAREAARILLAASGRDGAVVA